MCRLFGLNAGANRVHTAYWLLGAPDSISLESRRNPDGTGMGWYAGDGRAHVRRWPAQALSDVGFRSEAGSLSATTVITHVRAATAGPNRVENCHPFLIEERIMAHNGGFGDLAAVDDQLGEYRRYVSGDTDSERFAALIAQQTDARDGSVGAGLAAAAQWLAANVPLYSLNTIVATEGNLWALRYPDQRALHVATRTIAPGTGTPEGSQTWHGRSGATQHDVTPAEDEPVSVVVLASERIDGSENWRMLAPGELLHVAPDLTTTSEVVLAEPPADLQLPPGKDPNFDGF